MGKGSKISLGERWKDIHNKAFQDLKDIITNDITLAFPDFNKPFKLSTDASNTAIGGFFHRRTKLLDWIGR